jgi:hypothetical protein
LDLSRPSFAISFDLDPGAPRSARNYVADVIRADASQELREAVKLLTSDLVTRVVQQRRPAFPEAVVLRVWTSADLLRVELQGPRELLLLPPEPSGPHFDMILLDQIADRWSVDTGRDIGCVWFEIDRKPQVELLASTPAARS